MPKNVTPVEIWVNSGYGANTHQPFVSLKIKDIAVMISPSEARSIAHDLLECADAAEGDGFLVEFMMDRVGLELNHTGQLLRDFRKWRDEHRETVEKGQSND